MIVFETHPNKYLVYFAKDYLPTLIDMDIPIPYGVIVHIKETPEHFLKEGYKPLEYVDIPKDVKQVMMGSISVLYENAEYTVRKLKQKQ